MDGMICQMSTAVFLIPSYRKTHPSTAPTQITHDTNTDLPFKRLNTNCNLKLLVQLICTLGVLQVQLWHQDTIPQPQDWHPVEQLQCCYKLQHMLAMIEWMLVTEPWLLGHGLEMWESLRGCSSSGHTIEAQPWPMITLAQNIQLQCTAIKNPEICQKF